MLKSKLKLLFCLNQNQDKKELMLIWIIKALIHSVIIFCLLSWLSGNKIYYDSVNVYEHYLNSCNNWFEGSFFDSYTNLGRFYALIFLGRIVPYEVVFFLAAVLWWLVGLYMLRCVKIHNTAMFLFFSIVFVFDSIYIMQPSKELVAIVFWCIILNCFRINEKWSYAVAFALTLIYGLFFRPYILITLIFYVWMQMFRYNRRNAIILAMIACAGFVLLFQTGCLDFLVNARIIRNDNSTIYPVFSQEQLSGNVFFYLLNCLLCFIRIILPFETFITVPNRAFVIVPIQLGMLYICIRVGLYLYKNYKNQADVTKNDQLLINIVLIHLANLLTQAVFEPDYGSVLRHMCGTMPIYLFLLFEKEIKLRKVSREDSRVPELPVVFTHEGDAGYVYDVITQAEKICGKENVYLLGDESNKYYAVHWKNMNDFLGKEYDEFDKKYMHISYTPYEFEKNCFKRHFAIYEFMKRNSINTCISCDSDLLIYKDIRQMDWDENVFMSSSTSYSVFLGECMSPHCTYWKIEYLENFLRFVVKTYQSNTDFLKEINDKQKDTGYYWVGAISDMTLLTMWRQEEEKNNADFNWRNLNAESDKMIFDHNISTPDNLVADEFMYAKTLRMKKVKFENGKVFLIRKNNKPIETYTLHCQGGKKKYLNLLLKKNPIYFFYLGVNVLDIAVRELRRMVNRIEGNQEPIRWRK